MTLPVQDRRATYVGNGALTTFAYPFRIDSAAEIRVLVDGVPGDVANVTSVGATGGGNVEFSTAPADGSRVIIYGATTRDQSYNYEDFDRFPSQAHENNHDRGRMIDQEVELKVERALSLSDDDPRTAAQATLPAFGSAGYLFQAEDGTITLAPIEGGVVTPAPSEPPANSAVRFGAIADVSTTTTSRITANSTAVQAALSSQNAVDTGYIVIPWGVAWDFDLITQPDNVTIYDLSGWDQRFSNFAGTVKWYVKTNNASQKNAHEIGVFADRHPVFVADNIGDGTEETRASFITRFQGASMWGIGHGRIDGTGDRDFVIRDYTSVDTVRMAITEGTGEFGFNLNPVEGIGYTFRDREARPTIVSLKASGDERSEIFMGNQSSGTLVRIRSYDDGSLRFVVGGSERLQITANNQLRGVVDYVEAVTSNRTLSAVDSGGTFTNEGAGGALTLTLPAAMPGEKFNFRVIDAQSIRVDPQSGDLFRGSAAGLYKQSSAPGNLLSVSCASAGTWEFSTFGAWADEV